MSCLLMIEMPPSGQGDGVSYGGVGTLCESGVVGCRFTDGELEDNELSKGFPATSCESFVVIEFSLRNRGFFLRRCTRLAKVSWNLDAASSICSSGV